MNTDYRVRVSHFRTVGFRITIINKYTQCHVHAIVLLDKLLFEIRQLGMVDPVLYLFIYFQALADKYHEKSITTNAGFIKEIIFIQADVEECHEIANAFDIQVLPSFVIIEQIRKPSSTEQEKYFYDGNIKSTYIGEQFSKINEEIEDWLISKNVSLSSGEASLPDMSLVEEEHR